MTSRRWRNSGDKTSRMVGTGKGSSKFFLEFGALIALSLRRFCSFFLQVSELVVRRWGCTHTGSNAVRDIFANLRDRLFRHEDHVAWVDRGILGHVLPIQDVIQFQLLGFLPARFHPPIQENL